MQIFVYELITGGGMLGEPLPDSLLAEGRAMLAALVADLTAIEGVGVSTLQDARLKDSPLPDSKRLYVSDRAEERAQFEHQAATADWTVVIAPEFDGLLLERARSVEAAGGRLLGPSSALIELASDKQSTADHLAAAGVPVPRGQLVLPGDRLPVDFDYPAILKPVDGAGSQGLQLVAGATCDLPPRAQTLRLERFCRGVTASIAVLCGPHHQALLPPCAQHLSDDGRFTYLGGSLPLPERFASRAMRLAAVVLATLDEPLGYLGIDMILGDTSADDVVIEINPRLTTSYVGLRAACETNLAEAMLQLAAGDRPIVSFRPEPVQFRADGSIL